MSATMARDRAGVDVDPRIAERRRSVQGERRRRRRRRLLVVVVVLVVLAGGWFVTRTALLDVDRVQVEGAVHDSDDAVVEASGLRVGDQLLDVDEGAVADRLVASLPWVASADVSVGIDGVVGLTVVERTPVATVDDATGARFLVDATGRVLGPAEGDTTGLVPLKGLAPGAPGETLEGAGGALDAVGQLGPGARSRVTAVAVADDGSLALELTPQITVQLGPATDLEAKGRSLTTVLGQVEQAGVTRIDLRNPSDPVLGGP